MLTTEYGKQVSLAGLCPYDMKGICSANRGKSIRATAIAYNVSSTVPRSLYYLDSAAAKNILDRPAKPIREEIVEKTL